VLTSTLYRRLRFRLLRPAALAAFLLLLATVTELLVARSVHTAGISVGHATTVQGDPIVLRVAESLSSLQTAAWLLLAGQLLALGCLTWTLWRSSQRAEALLGREAEQSRARTAREAQHSQALLDRLSIATQAAGIYCWELDWNTYAITWDESRLPAAEAAAALRRHFGVELGSDLFKWVHPDDQQAGVKAMSESLERGESHVSFRYRIVLPDRSIRHVQAFARTYCDGAGKPQRSLGVSWDITAEVEIAEKAARNAANERAMFERLSVASQAAGMQCWEFDFKQNKVIWLDQGLEQQTSSPDGIEVAGRAIFEQLVPEDDLVGRQITDQALATQKELMSTRLRRRDADGNLRHVQMYQRLYYDEQGAPARAIGAMLDITESFQRQAELEALSIRFASATRAAKAGVWEYRAADGAIWWSDTMYAIYGCSAETFRPTLDRVLAMIDPADFAAALTEWNRALEESTQLHVRFRVIRPDGVIAHIESVAAVVIGRDSSDRRLVGTSFDISERVEADERERHLQRQLREASHQAGMAEVATGVLHNVGNVLNSLGVACSTAQMRLKACQLEKVGQVAVLLESKRNTLVEFLADSARGQRLPDYLTALSRRLDADAAAIHQEFEAINGHVQYLRQIIQAQQSFARIGGTHDEVDIRELIETALTLKVQELAGAEIKREIGELLPVRTDRYKLLQILVNFIANACDAMASNSAVPPRLHVRVRTTLDQLEISVEDSGVGIEPELLSRVWEFGFTTKAHGHGFGLHSAAVAAQQLGGSVSAESAGMGRGARFAVMIPISAGAEGRRDSAA
jgi:signal transduction histidine kinase